VVEQGKISTAAGVSSGIDMGLSLLDRIYGPVVAQSAQLGIEYDPQPPFDAARQPRHRPKSWSWFGPCWYPAGSSKHPLRAPSS
jgi:transcriptional regulator GlxA family with amidase domain